VPGDTYIERFEGMPRETLADGLTVVTASTGKARRHGLSGLETLPADHALLIPRCPSVHTFAMRFPLDLIWLARDGAVVRVDRDVPRGRIRVCLRARSVIETAAGRADAFVGARHSDEVVRDRRA
jgi:uncharacterized membrane protein (UPF0127 family)